MNSSVSRLTSAFAIITAILVCIGTLRSASAAAVSSYQDTTTPQNQIYVFPDGTSISVQKDLGTAVAMNDPSTYSSAHELMSIIVQHFMRNHGYQNTSYTQNASGEVFQVACANGTITTAYFDAPPSPPPPPTVLSCSITFDKNPIKQGESVSISWSSTKAQLFYINGIGYVGGTGSARVSPGSTSDFGGYVNDKADGTGNSVSCPAILTVSGSCPPEQIRVNGQCVTQCPSGFTYRDGQCVFVGCPLGYVRQGDQCVFSACPAGYVKDGDKCTRVSQCTTPPKCVGNESVNSCNGDTIATCDYGCAGGVCNPVPAPSGTINASPKLLKIGKTSLVSWSATNVRACTVTGTNGNSWTGDSSSGKTSSPIQSQTTYYLRCDGYAGSSPASIDKQVTVNIIPGWNEQ